MTTKKNTQKTSTTTNNTNIKKEETSVEIKINSMDPVDKRGYFSRDLEGFIVVPSYHHTLGFIDGEYVVAESRESIIEKDPNGWLFSNKEFLPALSDYNSLSLYMVLMPEGIGDHEPEEYEHLLSRLSDLLYPLVDHQNKVYYEELIQAGVEEWIIYKAVSEFIVKEGDEWDPSKWVTPETSMDHIISRLHEEYDWVISKTEEGSYTIYKPFEGTTEVMTERDLRDEYHFSFEE